MDLQAVLNDLKIDTITNFLIMEEKTLKTQDYATDVI